MRVISRDEKLFNYGIYKELSCYRLFPVTCDIVVGWKSVRVLSRPPVCGGRSGNSS